MHYVFMYMYSGVYWGASPGLLADHSHTAAAAGPAGCPGSQTAAVWRLNRHCGATQHYCGPGKHIFAVTNATVFHLKICTSLDNVIFVLITCTINV